MGARLSENFPPWGTTVNGELWEQEMLAHPTSESDGGALGWPTPTHMADSFYVDNSPNKEKRHSRGLASEVEYMVSSWPTPSAQGSAGEINEDLVRRGQKLVNSKTGRVLQTNLATEARQATWATPVAPAPHDSQNSAGAYRKPRAGYGVELPNQAIDSQLGPQAPQTETVGQESSPSDQTSPQPSPKKLNPNFVEWLMGLPIGWTDLKPLETESYRQWYENFSGGSDA